MLVQYNNPLYCKSFLSLELATLLQHKAKCFVATTVRFHFHFSLCPPKHPSAGQMLRDVGAVDFLTQLSPNVEPRLRAVIDGTLEQLFHLPELLPSHAAFSSHGQHATALTGVACYSLESLCFDSVF